MPDYSDLDPNGWWPHKKHTVGQRLGQVFTAGIYNPDDRYASALNKKRLAARAQAEEQSRVEEQEYKKMVARTKEHLSKYYPELTPEEIDRKAHAFAATQITAQVAANEASAQANTNKRKRDAGAESMQTDIGQYGAEADIAAEKARAGQAGANEAAAAVVAARNRGMLPKSEEAGETAMDNELAEMQADIADAGLRKDKVQVEKDLGLPEAEGMERLQTLGDSVNRRMHKHQVQTATDQSEIATARNTAQTAARQSAAFNNIWGDSAVAPTLAKLGLTKQFGVPIGYGSRMISPFPLAGENVMDGQQHDSGVKAYATTSVNKDMAGNVIGTTEKRRIPLGAPLGFSAGAVLPGAAPITGAVDVPGAIPVDAEVLARIAAKKNPQNLQIK